MIRLYVKTDTYYGLTTHAVSKTCLCQKYIMLSFDIAVSFLHAYITLCMCLK